MREQSNPTTSPKTTEFRERRTRELLVLVLVELGERLARERGLSRLDQGVIAEKSLEFIQAWDEGRVRSAPVPYLWRCLSNANSDVYRSDARWALGSQLLAKTSEHAVDPGEEAANREIVGLSHGLLTPPEQQLVALLCGEALSVRGTAKRLQVPHPRVQRAYVRLRERLRHRFEPESCHRS
ncbi:MAG: sigma-70 family RNA polymerase sigma factor [Phycisphaerales bacterium]|nr:sigma-70 family RNA polymerase sigma factor [Phycisphaerales bacterium]